MAGGNGRERSPAIVQARARRRANLDIAAPSRRPEAAMSLSTANAQVAGRRRLLVAVPLAALAWPFAARGSAARRRARDHVPRMGRGRAALRRQRGLRRSAARLPRPAGAPGADSADRVDRDVALRARHPPPSGPLRSGRAAPGAERRRHRLRRGVDGGERRRQGAAGRVARDVGAVLGGRLRRARLPRRSGSRRRRLRRRAGVLGRARRRPPLHPLRRHDLARPLAAHRPRLRSVRRRVSCRSTASRRPTSCPRRRCRTR